MQSLALKKPFELILTWALTSGLSAGLGAHVAVRFFPQAGFAQNPTGQYSIALFAFAGLVGLALGSAQYIVLRKFFLYHSRPVDAWLLWWVPATAIGVLALIVPLYTVDATALLAAPWLPALIMLPGAGILGVGQWLILHRHEFREVRWIVRTVIGTLLGASLGLIAAFASIGFASFSVPGMIEPVWAGFVGLGLGLFQGDQLSRKLTGQGAPRWLIISAIVFLVLVLPAIFSTYLFLVAWIH
jgi:hypothetical protein